MTEQTKTLLILGGVAVVTWLIYKRASGGGVTRSPIAAPGTGQSVPTSTNQGASGSADFWSTLGSAGRGLNGAVSSVESTYNNIYDLFGGGSSSTAPTGNNATGG